jgi:hypothetical protein
MPEDVFGSGGIVAPFLTSALDEWSASHPGRFCFWEIKPCSPLEVNRRFGETPSFPISTTTKQVVGFNLPWKLRRHVRPKRRSTSSELRVVISWKIERFTLGYIWNQDGENIWASLRESNGRVESSLRGSNGRVEASLRGSNRRAEKIG